jgi:hypothetical protein
VLTKSLPYSLRARVGSNAGDIRTRDISTFLFPNTYLYFNNDPTQCCVLGFHGYDLEPGGADNGFRERRYVLNYSSWISPGLFGSATDFTALSHELSETFNDPFVNNATPWWLSPNTNCQNSLETGDVIEGLRKCDVPHRTEWIHLSPSKRSAPSMVRGRDALFGNKSRLQLSGHHRARVGKRVAELCLHAAPALVAHRQFTSDELRI